MAGLDDDRWSTGAAWSDYDNDGDIDLYVANYIDFDVNFIPEGADAGMWRGLNVMYGPRGLVGAADALYRNEGDGTFTDVTQAVGVTDLYKRYGFTPLFSDFDRDGDPDLFVANDAGPNMFYRNQGNGTFAEEALEAAVALLESGDAQACMGAAAADYDNDGDFDLYVTNFALDYNTLYQNDGRGFFKDVTATAGLIYPPGASSAGARALPTLTTTVGKTSSWPTATSIPKSSSSSAGPPTGKTISSFSARATGVSPRPPQRPGRVLPLKNRAAGQS